jgi:uncharacterized membrane protein
MKDRTIGNSTDLRFDLKSAPLAILWAVYLVFLAGGIMSHVMYGGTPANMVWAAPFSLALAAAIVVASAPEWWRPVSIAAAIGLVAELIGVKTGVLRPLVPGVPVAVAGASMILFAYVAQMRVHPVLSALWMTAIDLVIDPLAANDLAYWQWRDGGPYFGVPILNFIAWFAVSLIIFYIPRETAPRSASIQMLGRTVLFFFCAIAAAHHYLFPAFFGLGLAALGYWRFQSIR